MKTPCWCTSVVHQYGGYLLWLSRRVIICTEQTAIYLSTFPNALNSRKAQNHEINIYFSINSIVASCHAPLTQKFKMLWFPNEARYAALKLQMDTNLPPLMPDEDKNFRGSLESKNTSFKGKTVFIWIRIRICCTQSENLPSRVRVVLLLIQTLVRFEAY